jgi:hypothetical protein
MPVSIAMPTAARAQPAGTSGRGPVRGRRTDPEKTAVTITAPIIGRKAAPVSIGVNFSVSSR